MMPEKDDRPKIVISVIDTGIGISKEDCSKLFKLYGCLGTSRNMNS
jgi:signal transduction histidine kinase